MLEKSRRRAVAAVVGCAVASVAVLATVHYWNSRSEAEPAGEPSVDPRLAAYHGRCIDRVTTHYQEMVAPLVKYAPGTGTTRVSVQIVVDGSIRRISVTQSSGDLALDDAVVKMIQKVGRFEPLPPELGLKSVDFSLAFGFQAGK
jgi:TonB family protein